MIDALVRKTVEAELHRVNSSIEWRAGDVTSAEVVLKHAQEELARLNELRDSLMQFLGETDSTTPRVWDHFRDVPHGVWVTDKDGDEWEGEDGYTDREPYGGLAKDHWAPYTEVVGK